MVCLSGHYSSYAITVPVWLVCGGLTLTNADCPSHPHTEDSFSSAYRFTASAFADRSCDDGWNDHSPDALWNLYWTASLAPGVFPLVAGDVTGLLWPDLSGETLVSQASHHVALTCRSPSRSLPSPLLSRKCGVSLKRKLLHPQQELLDLL